MCSRNLLFRDVSFIRRYLLFTPRLLGPIPGASFSLSCVLLLLLLPSTMHRVIAHQPTNQPLPCHAAALPCLLGRGRRSGQGETLHSYHRGAYVYQCTKLGANLQILKRLQNEVHIKKTYLEFLEILQP